MTEDQITPSRAPVSRQYARWAGLLTIGALVLVGPVYFAAEIERTANLAIDAARHNQVLVAGAIILALALDVFLPVPNGVTNTLAGAIFGFAVGSVVIWIGLMSASMLGYSVGAFAARPIARRFLGEQELARANRFTRGMGPLVLIFSRPVPVFAELATLAAGMAGMQLRQFLFLTGAGNLAVAVVFSAIGSAALTDQSGAFAATGSIVLPLAAWFGFRWWRRERA